MKAIWLVCVRKERHRSQEVSTAHTCCSGPLLTQTENPKTDQSLHVVWLLSQCSGHCRVGYLLHLVGRSAPVFSKYWTCRVLSRLEGAMVGGDADCRREQQSPNISTQGLAVSPPELMPPEQPAFFGPCTGGRTAVRKRYCTGLRTQRRW